MGCMFLSVLLQIKREQGKLSGMVMTILSVLVGCLTIGGIFALAMLYREYKTDVAEEMKIIFAITLFGVDQAVVSPAAISIRAAPAGRSCRGRIAHTGWRAPRSAASGRHSRVASACPASAAVPAPSGSSAC